MVGIAQDSIIHGIQLCSVVSIRLREHVGWLSLPGHFIPSVHILSWD